MNGMERNMGKVMQRTYYPTFSDFCHECYGDTDHGQWVVWNFNEGYDFIIESKDEILPVG